MWQLLVSSLFPLTVTSAVLWLLLALSVLSVTVMVERAFFFRAHRGKGLAEVGPVLEAAARGDLEAALASAEKGKGVHARVAAKALEAAPLGLEPFHEAKAAALTAERRAMEQRLAFLGTLGNNAPFLGLFGTVLGIIRAFHDLSLNVEGGPATVMAGISEALVATAAGMCWVSICNARFARDGRLSKNMPARRGSSVEGRDQK